MQLDNPVQLCHEIIINALTLSPATPLCPTWPSSPFGYREKDCVIKERKVMFKSFENKSKLYGEWCATYSWAVLSWRSRRTCRTLFSLGRKDHRKGRSTKRGSGRSQESPHAWSLPLREGKKLLIFTSWKNMIWVKNSEKRETMLKVKQKGQLNCL